MSSIARKNESQSTRSSDKIWNALTVFILLGTICVVGLFGLTFINPHNLLNPFPPANHAQAEFARTTATGVASPVWTATSLPPAATAISPAPAPTDPPTAAAVVPAVTATPAPTATAPAAPPQGYPFQLRVSPNRVPSTIMHPDQGCNWLGVGGQVFDLQGSPLVGLTIQLGGSLNGKPINLLSLTGTATQYGPGGFEFNLGDKPVATTGSLWIQLLDQAGLALSDRVLVDTSNDCSQNLVLLNFKQVR